MPSVWSRFKLERDLFCIKYIRVGFYISHPFPGPQLRRHQHGAKLFIFCFFWLPYHENWLNPLRIDGLQLNNHYLSSSLFLCSWVISIVFCLTLVTLFSFFNVTNFCRMKTEVMFLTMEKIQTAKQSLFQLAVHNIKDMMLDYLCRGSCVFVPRLREWPFLRNLWNGGIFIIGGKYLRKFC